MITTPFIHLKQTLLIIGTYALFIGVSIGNSNQSTASASSEIPWKLIKEHDGISVYSTKSDYSARFRGIGRVKVNDPYSIVAIMEDYENMPKWISLVASATEINRDDYYNRYMHATITPPILQTRDFVVKVSVSQDPKTKSITAILSNAYDHIPIDSKYIRLPVINGLLHAKVISNNELEITYELEANMRDILPANIVDFLIMFTPYLTIRNLREVVKNPKYHNLETDTSEIQFKSSVQKP